MSSTVPPIAARSHPAMDQLLIFTPDFRALYVSCPKTGCTTIKTVMAAAAGGIDPMTEDFGLSVANIHEWWVRHEPRWSGVTPRERLDLVQSPDVFRFTSVRDPYERIASCWLAKVARPNNSRLRTTMRERGDSSLLGFLRYVAETPPLARDIHCRRLVDLTGNGAVSFDAVIRHERFAADLSVIIERLAVRGLRIPQQNPARPTHAVEKMAELMGPAERALAAEIYADDFAAFGYPV